MKSNHKKNFINGTKVGIPIALGYMAVSFTLGIQARKLGIGPLTGALTSFGLHASAGEYIAYSLFGAGAAILSMVLMEAVANARYLLMSCALSQKLDENESMLKRFILGFFITDEIFGASIMVPGKLDPYYSYGMAAVAVPGWMIGTALGIIAGETLPARVVSALGVGLFGMFIACIVPEAKKNKVVSIVILISFAASFAAEHISLISKISSGTRTIILTVVISALAALIAPHKEDAKEEI